MSCNNKNPLQRSGVNQVQRTLDALLPEHVSVDERDYADLILFARNYASQLKYVDSNNVHTGDWTAFMSKDISVTMASLVKLNSKGCVTYVREIFDIIEGTDSSDITTLQNHFKALFDFAFSVTVVLDGYYKAIPDDFEFKEVLGNSIHSSLAAYYQRLLKYYDSATGGANLFDETLTFIYGAPPVDITLSQDFDRDALSDRWQSTSASTFVPTFNGATTGLKIINTCTHNLFTGIFDQYLKSLASITETSVEYLEKTLSSFPTHAPHYALYLTFIKLFKFAQDQLNGLTKRHLDFYYKEILQLTNKDAEPDDVHLVFELAKPVQQTQITEGTVFKAGKDVDGEEIYYAASEEVVLNKGAVSSVKSIFVKRDSADNSLQVYASPVANSEDGIGGKLTSAEGSWLTFGDENRPTATIGFAIASHYLYLTEGTRTITFTFYANEGEQIAFDTDHIESIFELQLTGEKEWITVTIQPENVSVDPTREFFKIKLILDGGMGAIVPYTEKTHQLNMICSTPVAMFTVKDAKANEAIWDLSFQQVGIDVSVTGLKNVAIQNDAGVLNPSKPFELFGASPHTGSAFILGSKEIFMKTLQPSSSVAVTIGLTWDNYSELSDKISAYDNDYTVNIYHLEDATWKDNASNVQLFEAQRFPVFMAQSNITPETGSASFKIADPFGADLAIGDIGSVSFGGRDMAEVKILKTTSSIDISLSKLKVATDFSDNANYDVTSVWGFLKIELGNKEFGHSTYAQDLADAAKQATITTTTSGNTTTTTIDMDEVAEPYTPKVKEISLSYNASTVIDFATDEEAKYFHITPFGNKDIAAEEDRTLLPAVAHEGELFIGIEDFVADQTLPLLFQIAEGSADPLASKQEMTWYYLATNNEWVEFEKEDITDATNDLTQSGIIRFSIADSASSSNSVMTEQLHWLRGVVAEKTNAVCKIIQVVAQAIKAEFTDYKDQGLYFKQAIAANSISKAVVSDATLKKISQPYASSGGRAKETDDHFYVRVSERLRHKNRGVSLWDFERIVLEAFPTIYKAKCINHTQIVESTVDGKTIYTDNELKPGSVVVVTIPDLTNQNAYDPLRPYTSLGLLTEIKQFLYKQISSHVNLDVRNPRFEEIQLEFSVKYVVDDNEFYTKQLRQEIEQFMAPWAFDPTVDIEFGGKISKSVLINFIEERSYVDFLSCVKMFQIVDGVRSSDLEEAVATTARSVFVSVKAEDEVNGHLITYVTVTECVC